MRGEEVVRGERRKVRLLGNGEHMGGGKREGKWRTSNSTFPNSTFPRCNDEYLGDSFYT
jgi:hypothetical protein